MQRLKDLNPNLSSIGLVLAYQGNSEDVNYKIAQGGQLTPNEKNQLGIKLKDDGYPIGLPEIFEPGKFIPSTMSIDYRVSGV